MKLVAIRDRWRLNREGSDKETYHLALDLKGTGISYEVGDCLGVHPENHPNQVSQILDHLKARGDEEVLDRRGNKHRLKSFLSRGANLERVGRKLLDLSGMSEAKDVAEFLANGGARSVTAETLVANLSPLLPRLYSIASSMKEVGQEAHLTVQCVGTCSDYLCHLTPVGKEIVPIYLQRAKEFTLAPESQSKPIIMIGPGTGVAPFRGFMQERRKMGCSSKNWLFFGERRQALDFYYEDDWRALETEGFLRLDTAFSRDGEQKVYVQHRMLQRGQELWRWIEHEGAYIYVCGDAKRMAKDVDATLLMIGEEVGGLSSPDAKKYFKELRLSGRYLRDIY